VDRAETVPAQASRTCPNAPADARGAVLIGIVGADGLIKAVTPALPVTPALAEAAARRDGGAGLRFATRCVEDGCGRWEPQARRCGVADALLADPALKPLEPTADERLPVCAIRRTCRWFSQAGGSACRRCPIVVGTTPALVT
jgi:hypothetical protein